MTPAETREWVLKDHLSLRSLLDELEDVGQRVRSGERRLLGPLRLTAERFLHRFEDHTRWEDEHLRPALLDADAWGQPRAARLHHDHSAQRELLPRCGPRRLRPRRRCYPDRLRQRC